MHLLFRTRRHHSPTKSSRKDQPHPVLSTQAEIDAATASTASASTASASASTSTSAAPHTSLLRRKHAHSRNWQSITFFLFVVVFFYSLWLTLIEQKGRALQ
jgi:hypothetical protein